MSILVVGGMGFIGSRIVRCLVELGEVSPPFGMNLFMMKSLAPDIPINVIFRGVFWFVVADCIKVALLIAYPWIVLWLPNLAFK